MVKKIAFEKAIAVDKVDKTLADMFKDMESIVIEADYTGPTLENGKVTVTFMEGLLDWYREQKKLHRKYAYKVSSVHPSNKTVFSNPFSYSFTDSM